MTYINSPSCQIGNLPELLEKYIGFKTDGRFVDVGAYDGVQWSNTWSLAQIGWKGIAIEPEPDLFKKCRQNHDRLVHDVECLQIAISDYEGNTKLYLGGSISLIDTDTLKLYNTNPNLKVAGLAEEKFVNVPVTTLDTLLSDRDWPPGTELISIDAKGVEIKVLAGLDLGRWEPKMVIIETAEKNPDEDYSQKFEPINEILTGAGYENVYGDQLNSVYVR